MLKKGFSLETFTKLTVTLDKQNGPTVPAPSTVPTSTTTSTSVAASVAAASTASAVFPKPASPMSPSPSSLPTSVSFSVSKAPPPPSKIPEERASSSSSPLDLANVDEYVLTFQQLRDNDPLGGDKAPKAPVVPPKNSATAVVKGPRDGDGTLAGGASLRDALGGTVPNAKRKVLLHQFLMQACSRGDVNTTKALMMALGFDGQSFRDKNGVTSLLAAAGQGHVQVVRLLLEELKVDVAVLNAAGVNAFQLAAQARNKEVMVYMGEALMKLGLAAQALCLLGHSAAQMYSLALNQLLVRDEGTKPPKTKAPTVSVPISFQLLQELALLRASGSVRSTRVKALKIKVQANGLPVRHKRFGGAQPNPVLCVLLGDGQNIDFNIQYTNKTRAPRFPNSILYSPVFPRRVEQYVLLGLYDDSPHGLLPIGYARIALQDFVGMHNFTYNLTQFSSDGFKTWFHADDAKMELVLETEVVHNSLVEQVDTTILKYSSGETIDRTAVLTECGVASIESSLLEMLDKCAECNFLGRKVDLLLGLDSLPDSSTQASLAASPGSLRFYPIALPRQTTVSSASLGGSGSASSISMLPMLNSPSAVELMSSASMLDFSSILGSAGMSRSATLADFPASVSGATLAGGNATLQGEITLAQASLAMDDKWDPRNAGMPLVTEFLHDAQRQSDSLRVQKSELIKVISSATTGDVIAVFQAVCNKVANYRASTRELVKMCQNAIATQKLRVRILTTFMEKLEALAVNLRPGIPSSTDEWPSAEKPELGVDVSTLSISSTFMSLSLQSGLATSRERVLQRFAEMKLASGEVANSAFRQQLMETIVMAVWLQRDIETSLAPSLRSLQLFLGSVKQELTTELEEWEVEKDFYGSFHLSVFNEVKSVGLSQLKKLQRTQKSLRHKLAVREAEALRVELMDKDALSIYMFQQQTLCEVGVIGSYVDPRTELQHFKQKCQVIKDEIDYLKNTFVEGEEQPSDADGGARLDTVWYIPPSSIEISGKIGSGQYGDVYKGTLRSAPVALKVYKEGADSFAKEFTLWKELRHPHVIQLLGYSKIRDQLAMIMPFCETSLDAFLKTCPPLNAENMGSATTHPSWRVRTKIALQVASGMVYLHESNVMHRDLKSANVLLQGEGRDVRICDFGFSKKFHWARSMSASGKGSPYTMAPEVYHTGESSTAADVYSFGIVLWEIIYSSTPYTNLRIDMPEPAFMNLIQQGSRPLILPLEDLPPLLRQYHDLFMQCWQTKPGDRPTLGGVLQKLLELHESSGGSA